MRFKVEVSDHKPGNLEVRNDGRGSQQGWRSGTSTFGIEEEAGRGKFDSVATQCRITLVPYME